MAITGQHTGRSVQDKFVADDPEVTKEIWWGKVNQKLDPAKFDAFADRRARLPRGHSPSSSPRTSTPAPTPRTASGCAW